MRSTVRSILAVSVVGAVHSLSRGRPARFAGIRLPGTAVQHALTIGSPLSAPPAMLAALVIADRRGRDDVVRVLSAMFVVGILGEADTWTMLRRGPRSDPIAALCAAFYVVLPATLMWQTR